MSIYKNIKFIKIWNLQERGLCKDLYLLILWVRHVCIYFKVPRENNFCTDKVSARKCVPRFSFTSKSKEPSVGGHLRSV